MSHSSAAPPNLQESVDVRSYVRPIWRHKLLVVAIVVVAAAATYFISRSETKRYSTSTDLYIQVAYPSLPSSDVTTSVGPSTDQLGDVAQLVTSSAVQAAVEEDLGVPLAQAGSISAAPSSTSDFVTITAVSKSARLAARLANAYANQYLLGRKLTLVTTAREAISAAEKTLKAIPSGGENLTNLAERQNIVANIQSDEQAVLNPQIGAAQTAPAPVPGVPSSPRPTRNTVFAAGGGLLLGILAAFALELLSTMLRTPTDLEAAYRKPVLTVLPKVPDPSPFSGSLSDVPVAFTEALRMLRFQLRLNPDAGEPKTILVTSGVQNEGKSTVVRDLALIYAIAGQNVLAIDTDLRKPSLARLFHVEPKHTLTEVLSGDVSLADAVAAVSMSTQSSSTPANGSAPDAPAGRVDILALNASVSGSVNLLASSQMRDLLGRAVLDYDVVFIDTAPLLMVADSTPLLPIVDSVLVVARLGVVTRQHAERLIELIDRIGGVRFTGLIANGLEGSGGDGYGYGYGYGSYGAEEAPRPISAQVPLEQTASETSSPSVDTRRS